MNEVILLKRTCIILACIVTLVFALGPVCSAASAPQPLKYAFVERVIDAYTLEVSIGRKLHTVRLLGLSPLESLKPEMLNKLGDLKVDNYVSTHAYNTFVYLEFDAEDRDFEDRLLAYVWLEKPEKRDASEVRTKMLNAKLLAEGYGQWMLTLPNYKYTSYLRSSGEEAQKKHLGIWSKSK